MFLRFFKENEIFNQSYCDNLPQKVYIPLKCAAISIGLWKSPNTLLPLPDIAAYIAPRL